MRAPGPGPSRRAGRHSAATPFLAAATIVLLAAILAAAPLDVDRQILLAAILATAILAAAAVVAGPRRTGLGHRWLLRQGLRVDRQTGRLRGGTISRPLAGRTWAGALPAAAIAAAAALAGPAATPARADCLRAVFFDLGETLVTATGGGTFTLKPGAQETVDELQARGVQLGIITNVPAGWTREDLEAILLEPEFLDEFDVLTLSSQAPAAKPNPAIYTFAHAALPKPVPIAACAFVGETLGEIANSEEDPTLGARAAGMIGIHLSNSAPSPLADYTVSPDDLPAIVDVVAGTCPELLVDGFDSGDTSAWDACTCP